MSRNLPSGFQAAIESKTICPVFLVSLAWPGGTVYFWNGYADLPYGGNTYVGTGHLGGIAEIKEQADGTANGTTLTMSGLPTALVAQILQPNVQNRPAQIYFGLLSGAGFTVNPYLIFDGLIDTPSLTDDGTTATISIALEKEFIDNRTGARRYTNEDLQLDFPGDRGLEFVARLATATFTWGKSTYYPPVDSLATTPDDQTYD